MDVEPAGQRGRMATGSGRNGQGYIVSLLSVLYLVVF